MLAMSSVWGFLITHTKKLPPSPHHPAPFFFFSFWFSHLNWFSASWNQNNPTFPIQQGLFPTFLCPLLFGRLEYGSLLLLTQLILLRSALACFFQGSPGSLPIFMYLCIHSFLLPSFSACRQPLTIKYSPSPNLFLTYIYICSLPNGTLNSPTSGTWSLRHLLVLPPSLEECLVPRVPGHLLKT